MKRRIFKNLFSLSACVVLLSCGIFIWIYYGGISAQVTSRIANQAQHYAAVLNTQGGDSTAFLSLIAGDDEERVTLIAANGAVLYDNRAELSSLDNHAARPEVAAALQSGKGDAKRRSDTFGRDIFYAAVRTRAGEVIRISKEVSDVWGILDRSAHWIFLAVIAALALSLVLSRSLTKRLLAPFATLDLQMPLQNDTYAELSPLLLRIDAQNRKIAAQLRQLSEKNRELAQVEANMNEGLVVLGSDGRVVLANRAAQRIFGT
ncbi:MAG: hypothetical protein LBM28_02390, partial [Oscillospiraceae bacterium]|nr:hypothetical protein [Oscillospiraceae bacterium]